MFRIVRLALPILLILWVFRQVRKPSGPLGRRVVQAMNLGHATMTDWGLEQVTVPKNAVILDVGCGDGRTVRRLAALAPEDKIVGLDYSAASVAVSRDTNAQEIETGRVQIEQGSVAALPFSDRTFDIVTAVETHYYWPELPANVREIVRVLKPGGTFVLIAETCRGGPFRLVYGIVHAATPRRVLERPGAPGSPDSGGTYGGHYQACIREELDLRHGPQAVIVGTHARIGLGPDCGKKVAVGGK
jgi:SAM-dependent methyltransferase